MIGYGQFATALVSFLILAFAIYQLVRMANRANLTSEMPPKGPSEELSVLREIRDSLKARP